VRPPARSSAAARLDRTLTKIWDGCDHGPVTLLTPELADLDFCYVTTTGRTTGKPHRIEIWFAAHPTDDTIFMMSGGRERADWVRNLVASPSCSVEIGEQRFVGYARVIEGTDDDELARTRVHDKYAHGDDLASWRANALPLAVDLTASR
jgi:deazaflavin-dependent oxidoreductase (nitroreductase family)